MTHSFDGPAAKALEDQQPIRVFMDPLTRRFGPDYKESIQSFVHGQIREILQSACLDHQPLINLLGVELWDKRVRIVFDVNYQDYDWYTAHDASNNCLPVFRFKLDKAHRGSLVRDEAIDRRVNSRIAELHRRGGYHARPPYVKNYCRGAPPNISENPRPT